MSNLSEYRLFGRTGVKVSPLTLGCMMFGRRTELDDSIRIIDRAIDEPHWPFSTHGLAHYLVTQSNVIAAVEFARKGIDDAFGWIVDQANPFFRAEQEVFRFQSSITHLPRWQAVSAEQLCPDPVGRGLRSPPFPRIDRRSNRSPAVSGVTALPEPSTTSNFT